MTLFRSGTLTLLAVLFVFLSFLPEQAKAQKTPVGKEMADAYYQNCMAKPNEILSDKTKDMLCTCTAARMMKSLTVEEMRTMAQNDEAGRLALNKMLVEVYTPCMEFPIRDLIYDNCIKNKASMPTIKNSEGLCGCMASETAEYAAKEGPQTIQKALKDNPFITDPMGPLMESDDFQKASQKFTMSCLMKYKN